MGEAEPVQLAIDLVARPFAGAAQAAITSPNAASVFTSKGSVARNFRNFFGAEDRASRSTPRTSGSTQTTFGSSRRRPMGK
jgi:hypothetical protein